MLQFVFSWHYFIILTVFIIRPRFGRGESKAFPECQEQHIGEHLDQLEQGKGNSPPLILNIAVDEWVLQCFT